MSKGSEIIYRNHCILRGKWLRLQLMRYWLNRPGSRRNWVFAVGIGEYGWAWCNWHLVRGKREWPALIENLPDLIHVCEMAALLVQRPVVSSAARRVLEKIKGTM